MKTQFLLVLFCFSLASVLPAASRGGKSVQSLPSPIVLTAPVELRDNRSPNARLISTLQPGTQIRIAFPEDGWSAVFRSQETRGDESLAVGYILTPENPTPVAVAETAAVSSASVASASTRSAGKTRAAAVAQAAVSSEKPLNPSGVSVQCNGITKKGTRCSRKTTNTSGYCTQHNKSSG